MGNKKKIEKYDSMLRKYQSKKEIIKIGRTVREGKANIYGVIMGLSKQFMYLAEDDGFRFNAEIIIKTDHYDSIRCSDFEKTIKKILKSEKQLTKTKPKRTKIDLSSWNTLFIDLKKLDIHVIVECEDLKEPTFTIGPIEKISKKSVFVRNYDANGQLDKKLTKLKFEDITLVKFNDDYSKTFRKYLKYPKLKKETQANKR